MNPVEEQLPPPPQPPQPHRISTSCDRHPDEHFTGFCPSCLFERLSVLDQSASASSTATAGRKSASAALKSIFRGSAAGERPTFRTRPGSFLPELRRTKSFSGGKNEGGFGGFAGIFEPQRKSCDVRARNTLHSLFNQDDGKRTAAANTSTKDAAAGASASSSRVPDQVDTKFNNSGAIVLELNEEGEREREVFFEEEEEEEIIEEEKRGEIVEESGEIEEIEEPIASNNSSSNPKLSSEEQLEEILEAEKVELKPMKDHIDLDSQNKKAGGKDFKELAGSFWSAASVFSKKLKSWTKKNSKLKKHSGGRTVQVNKKGNAARNCRETQSEIADYGYGRRSCDTDPRFSLDVGRMSLDYGRISLDAGRMSLDAGRMSLDDPRYSFDEPRASWDGYLIGGGRPTNFPRMPSMLSVVEDSPAPAPVHPPPPPHQPSVMVMRKDNQIPLEEEPRRSTNEEEFMPGGATQTKDYYSDSSSRRRKSLDRSNSIRKTAAAVVAEIDEIKSAASASNAKVTPATAVEYLHGASGRELRDSNPNSLRDDCSESFDLGFRDSSSVIGTNGDRKGGAKKSKSWKSWNIWGLIVKKGNNKDDDDDRYSRANGVERSYSESWQELGRDGYGGDPRVGFNRNGFRSNSSVSWRNSYSGSIGGSVRKSNVETNGHSKKKSNEFVLERNRSARYSPNDVDNGLLRFYLTPMRGSRRGQPAKPKPAAYSHTIARNMLRMY